MSDSRLDYLDYLVHLHNIDYDVNKDLSLEDSLQNLSYIAVELDNRKFMNTMKTTIARYDLDEGFKDRFIKYLEDSIFESSKRVTIASRESFERKRRESIMGTL